MLVHRFDVAALGAAQRTPQGFLRLPAHLTRAGVLEYRRADGSVVRELRPPEEVFAAKSLATLSAAPVTDLHPTEMVTPQNVRALQIGHVSDEVKADGQLVAAHVTIQEAEAIAAVERGDRRELSCGYQCRIDQTPGVYDGQPYDQVQRDVSYNHVALGPKNWGRAGRDVALRIDAADGGGPGDDKSDVFRLDKADALSVAMIAPLDDKGHNMELVTVRVDGVDVENTKQGAQVIATLQGKLDALQGRLDAEVAAHGKTKDALATASDPKRLDEALSARVALTDAARRVLPAEYKYDGQSSRQVQEAVLTHIEPGLDLKDRSDEYVSARFDQAMSERAKSTTNLDDARRLTTPSTKRPAARADAREPVVPDWQKPLSYHFPRSQKS